MFNFTVYLLPTPTAVMWVGFSPLFQSIFPKPVQLGSPNLTYKCSTMIPGKPFILGLEGQRSRSQHLCRSSDRMQYCLSCCICKLCYVFPAVIPCQLAIPFFTGVTVPRPLGFCTLLSAGF